jgi:hypothetical protein
LEQDVNFPTRQDNILDLVLTSHPSLVNRYKPLPGISDHDIVLIDANVRATRTRTPKRKIYLWKTANTQELQDEVRTNMALFFLLIILWTSVVIHGCVGFDLDNFEGTDFSMAFNRMFLNEVHMSYLTPSKNWNWNKM